MTVKKVQTPQQELARKELLAYIQGSIEDLFKEPEADLDSGEVIVFREGGTVWRFAVCERDENTGDSTNKVLATYLIKIVTR